MADVGSFTQLLTTLEQADFFIGVLPFLLSYLVFYAVLENVPVIEEKDNFPPLIALIFAFFVSFFIVQNPAYQMFFVSYLGTLTVGVIGVLGLFMLLGLTGTTDYFKKNVMAVLGLIIAAVAFTVSGGLDALTLGEGETAIDAIAGVVQYSFDTGLIWAAVILGVLWFTMRDPSGDSTLRPLLFEHGPGPDSEG